MRRKTNKNKRTPVPQRKQSDFWSSYQNNIFSHVSSGNGHGVVLASPGAGKTTTIVESLFYVPRNETTLNLAFNTSVATELMLRSPSGTKSRTFHQFGLETVRNNWGHLYDLSGRKAIDSDGLGVLMLAGSIVGSSDKTLKLREAIVWAVSMAKTMLANTPEQIEKVCCDFGIPTGGISNSDFAEVVQKILDTTKREPLVLNGNRVISFDDMLWLPHVNGWIPEQFDRVFVDEAQDLSASRVSLVLKALKPGGRMCAFADPWQAIYQFAGATPGIVTTLSEDLAAINLPLSVSYRCPKRVVELARDINPDIQAAPSAIDGVINHIDPEDLSENIRPGSAILSRTNFPLVSTAFDLVKRGIKTSIQGKDIGNRFIWRIDGWNDSTVQGLRKSINAWKDEYTELSPKNSERISDEAMSIIRFTEDAPTIAEVKSNIRSFFDDKQGDHVKLSTTHKAKGLEWDDVYMLSKTYKAGKSEEEDNVYYVSLTRAKKSLTFIQ